MCLYRFLQRFGSILAPPLSGLPVDAAGFCLDSDAWFSKVTGSPVQLVFMPHTIVRGEELINRFHLLST